MTEKNRLLTPDEFDKALEALAKNNVVPVAIGKIDKVIMKAQDAKTARLVAEEIKTLRSLLWANHPCDGKYGDDGELQCNRLPFPIDFKRDAIGVLESKCGIHNCQRQGMGIPEFMVKALKSKYLKEQPNE